MPNKIEPAHAQKRRDTYEHGRGKIFAQKHGNEIKRNPDQAQNAEVEQRFLL